MSRLKLSFTAQQLPNGNIDLHIVDQNAQAWQGIYQPAETVYGVPAAYYLKAHLAQAADPCLLQVAEQYKAQVAFEENALRLPAAAGSGCYGFPISALKKD